MLKNIRLRKMLVRLVFAFAFLVTLLLAAMVFENWRGARAWTHYQTVADARGEKLWIAQFVPPPVPDAENFAAIPIFQDLSNKPGAAGISPFDLGFQENHPGLANPSLGERFNVVKWRDAFAKSKQLDAPSDDAARDLLRALDRFEPTLQQLRDAAMRPHSRFPVKWEAGFDAVIPHLGPLQGATRLFALRMEAHLALGESAAAYADFRDGLQMYRVLRLEPVLICGLVRVSILALLENAVWDGLVTGAWSDAELRALEADFAALRLIEDWRFAIASERGGANAMLERFAARPEEIGFLFNADCRRSPTFTDHVRGRLFPRGWLRQNQIKINEWFEALLTRIDPAATMIPIAEPDEAKLERLTGGGLGKRAYYSLLAHLIPAYGTVEKSYLVAHTGAQQARTACAIALHRRAHGAFPERLDELVPAFMGSVPLDICDGAPLRYRRTEAGWELWSIGANRVDDGAQTLPKKSVREQPDWVWRM